MYVQPNSVINFHTGIPAFDGRRRLWFPTQQAQDAYFTNHIAASNVNVQYVKPEKGELFVSYSLANVRQCTYISFRNPAFENVTYYCRIVNAYYKSNEVTRIIYAVDKWLTYGHEATYFPSGIIREHLSKAEVTAANTNPYDPAIIDLDTPEDLPFSDELQEPNYDIDGTNNFGILFDTWYDKIHTWAPVLPEASIKQLLKRVITIVAIAPFTPISTYEEGWWADLYNYLSENAGTPNDGLGFTFLSDEPDTIHYTYGVNLLLGGVASPQKLKTAIPHPYNCYMFSDSHDPNLFNDIIQHAQLSNATILAVYGVPLYVVLSMITTSGNTPLDSISHELTTASGLNVRHKKLCRAPYARIDLITPFNERKSLNYEDFKEAREGNNIKLALYSDFNLSITAAVAPVNYKLTGLKGFSLSKGHTEDVNFPERIEITAFPQIPYATDSFLSAIAAANAAALRGATVQGQNMRDLANAQLQHGQEAAARGLVAAETSALQGGIKSAIGLNPAGAAGAAWSAYSAGEDFKNLTNENLRRQVMSDNEQAMIDNADQLSMAGIKSSAIYKNMEGTKRAYGYDYNAGTSDGRGMYTAGSFMDILAIHVKLRNEILALYDKYFDAFGYRSRRIATPRVLNFTATADADKPSWWDLDGYKITYVQTEGAVVSHPARDVAEYLETMLNAGVQFINGTELT